MLKIFSVTQIKQADAFTISHEPISGIDLMERAAKKCADWIINTVSPSTPVKIFCGTGNNGGDGLAIARILYLSGKNVSVYVFNDEEKFTPECKINFDRFKKLKSGNLNIFARMMIFLKFQAGK